MIAWVPLLFALIGALTYALSTNVKVAELGRATFHAAMIAGLLALAGHTVRLLP